MYETTYHRPTTLAEAAALFAAADDAAYLSGGHTMLPTMKGRLAAPSSLIDLRHIPELNGISVTAAEVRSAERSVGKARVRKCGYRWSPAHKQKILNNHTKLNTLSNHTKK